MRIVSRPYTGTRSGLARTSRPPGPVAEQINLPCWRSENEVESLETLASLMVEYGLTPEEPDVSSVLLQQ
jgi:hypothetical protein